MKRKLLAHIFFLLLSPSFLHAAELAGGERGSITISEWFSTSDSWYEISGGDPGAGGRSRLDFNNDDALITKFDGRLVLNDRIDLLISYGYGDIDKGEVTDTDWVTSSAYGLNNLKFSESRSDGRGDTTLQEIGGRLLFSTPGEDNRMTVYFGYMNYEDSIRMTNGVQTYADNLACAPLGHASPCFLPVGTPYPGLDSTYDFQWEFFKLGIEAEYKGDKIGVNGGIFYLYLENFKGEAYWNLRAGTASGDFRVQPPNFIHTATEGDGFDTFLSASYNLSSSAKLLLGYRYVVMKVKNGAAMHYLSPVTCGGAPICYNTQPLDSVEAARKGPYISVDLSF